MSYRLYIIYDLGIHIVPYLIKPYDQTITIISFSRVGFYRVESELSDDTMFDMIGPIFTLKNLVENGLFRICMIQWQPRFRNHQQVWWC